MPSSKPNAKKQRQPDTPATTATSEAGSSSTEDDHATLSAVPLTPIGETGPEAAEVPEPEPSIEADRDWLSRLAAALRRARSSASHCSDDQEVQESHGD